LKKTEPQRIKTVFCFDRGGVIIFRLTAFPHTSERVMILLPLDEFVMV